MAAYLTVAELKLLSIMPSGDIDAVETIAAGWIDANLEKASRDVDSRLRKRYSVPFEAPYPDKVQQWVADIVTPRVYLRRGVNALDAQFQSVEQLANRALAEIEEAANAEHGLFDLPLRSDTTATGITAPTTLAYAEASPYVGFDMQRLNAHDEDDSGEGTYW